jgi:DNA polymerase III epsilon subunit-like protein
MDERTTADYQSDQDRARAWAAKMLAMPELLILDTETSGLHDSAEIVQIAIMHAATGHVLLDTLIKPTRPIPRDASAIHGITDAMVADMPTFAEVAPQLRELLYGQTVVIYNADFDCRMLKQSASAAGVVHELGAFFEDAMEPYSAWYGDWSQYHGSYRWKPLPDGDHSALGDCKACLDVLKRMAEPPF